MEQKCIIDGVEYVTKRADCSGCVAENNESLCVKLPDCSNLSLSLSGQTRGDFIWIKKVSE